MFLLSAFYENVHETVQSRVAGRAGDSSRKGTHAYNLERARQSLFGKIVVVLNNLKTNSEFSQFVSLTYVTRHDETRCWFESLAIYTNSYTAIDSWWAVPEGGIHVVG